jgi:hypothetical protein
MEQGILMGSQTELESLKGQGIQMELEILKAQGILMELDKQMAREILKAQGILKEQVMAKLQVQEQGRAMSLEPGQEMAMPQVLGLNMMGLEQEIQQVFQKERGILRKKLQLHIQNVLQ